MFVIMGARAPFFSLCNDTLIPTILKSEDGSISKVYQLDGTGYKGIEPIYTNVTDDVLRQVYSKADNLKPTAAQAGKEGVGG